MKFINYLETITGIGIFPLISLSIFFIFFSAVTFWIIKADKGYINKIKNLPFEGDESETSLNKES
jgi:cytochrome c oxidase cbb3-type subunit 4